MIRREGFLVLACLGALLTLTGCPGDPAPTSSGILKQMEVEFGIPFNHSPDIDQDACLYPVLVDLWQQYDWYLDGEKKAEFKFELLKRYDALEFTTAKRVAKITGKANFLLCQLGWQNPNGGGPDWILEHSCGVKMVDPVNVQVDGENREPVLALEIKGNTTLALSAEYVDFEGDFKLYHVRNLQGEFKRFDSVDDATFRAYLGAAPAGNGLPLGMLVALRNPHITYPVAASGVRCGDKYRGARLMLKDLLAAKPAP